MSERRVAIVPDLVGQPVHVAQEAMSEIGLGLASFEPDGPGLRSRTWPGLFWITDQDPSAGSAVEYGSQIRIHFVEDGQGGSDVLAPSDNPLPSLVARAEVEHEADPPARVEL